MRDSKLGKLRDEDEPRGPCASAVPGQVYRPIVCTHCGAPRPAVARTSPTMRVYECRSCRRPFKIPVVSAPGSRG